MGVNSLPKTVTGQRRDCDLNPGLSAPEASTLTTRLPSHPSYRCGLTVIQLRHGRPHIGANGVSYPLEKWMKN